MASPEQLMAYADGQLEGAALAEVEAAIAADPALAKIVASHKALGGRLSAAYAPVLAEPIPAALLAAVERRGDQKVVALPTRSPAQRWGGWGAMAACLVAGLVLGNFIPKGGLIGQDMTARPALDRALDETLVAQNAVDERSGVRIGVSFKDGEGRYCRTFEAARDGLAGLACREAGDWRVELAAATPKVSGEDAYRQASALPPQLAAAVDEAIVGAPLDAAGEAAAKKAGWR